MVACDIRMQILPDTLNGIMVRTVRWQKVQPDSFRKIHQRHRDDVAAMNAVIVQDHVDGTDLKSRATFDREGGATWPISGGPERSARTAGAAHMLVKAWSQRRPGGVA